MGMNASTDLTELLSSGVDTSSDTDLSALLDNGTGAVSPEALSVNPPVAGAAVAGGASYDGASKIDRLINWSPPLRSADADMLREKGSLDARARDTLRNDAYVAGGDRQRKDSIVGAEYRLNAKPATKILWGKEDPTWESEFQEEIETLFALDANSEQCWFDVSRKNTFTELVRLNVGVHMAGGESLCVSQWMKDDGRPFRSALQMVDADRLSTPMSVIGLNQSKIRNGVLRDRWGAPKAYFIRNEHPNEGAFSDFANDRYTWERVPARTPWGRLRVCHIFETMRPDQTRGLAEIVTALTECRMTKHFRKTELERAVLAASYAMSIESEFPDNILDAMGGDVPVGENASVAWMTSYLEAIASYSAGARNLHMDGTKIPVFAPGTSLKIQNPGGKSPMGDKYEQSLLRYIAAALGVSYEELSRDFTQTNYSSARAAFGLTWKTMQTLKKMVADRFANFAYRLWLEELINNNQVESLKRRNVPKYYEGRNAEAYSQCEWIGAGQGQIDPLKETQASILKIKAGLSTKEIEIAKMSGGDWRATARQISRERAEDEFYKNPSIYDTADTTDVTNSLTATPSDGE